MGILQQTDSDYKEWLGTLKQQIRQSQLKAVIQVNRTLLELYWCIGADLVAKNIEARYGSGIINQLSRDLRSEFPEMQGFSTTNLRYIKRWYLFYNQDNQNQPQLVANFKPPKFITDIPWGHNREIISKCSAVDEALFYARKTIEEGWSRVSLIQHIESGGYVAQGKAISNFSHTLPEAHSELAQESLKDPYNFDFLLLTAGHKEKELEDALEQNITKFLLELGTGFAFMGRQVEIVVSDRSFFIDMLFYNVKLRCYVVIELKTTRFEPEFAGKLNFYVTAIDRQLRGEQDNATIGLLICKTKDNIIAEYALSDIHKPVSISSYQLQKVLPKGLKSVLPSIKEVEIGLRKWIKEEQQEK